MKAMNVSELARRLRVSPKQLQEILPSVGIDVGRRAIKIDGRQAQHIIENWPRFLAEYRAKKQAEAEAAEQAVIEKRREQAPIPVPATIRVRDFAEKLNVPLPKVMGELMKNGVLSTMNQEIDFDTASIIGSELGFEIVATDGQDAGSEQATATLTDALAQQNKEGLLDRPPVVVVMGHVDHGKTKLLDTIREANVVAGESGGITQHIGAYQAVKKDRLITFIDTPGHEAFITMRSRGARIADIAILVVAADDSIQEQTKESIKIIKSAKLPMIVAINKIDKPDANLDKVKSDLAAEGLTPEDWGGKTIAVPISAKEGTGIDELLDTILLVADLEKEHIQADPGMAAVGTIIESHIDKSAGPMATALVQAGTLHNGDNVTVNGVFYGKIRAMKDHAGKNVSEALPSMPVQINGLKSAPSVGDVLKVEAEVDRKAKVKKYQLEKQMTYVKPMEQVEEGEEGKTTLDLVIKADVLGSLEAIIDSLAKIEHEDVAVNIIGKGLGNVTEAEVERAAGTGAKILAFHTPPTQAAERLAKDKKVEIHEYEVIYKLVEEARAWLQELIKPEVERKDMGRLKVLKMFKKDKDGMVLGGSVTKGKIVLGGKVDVMRDGGKLVTGEIEQLQSNKVEVKEVEQGNECGLRFKGKPWIEEGDVLECFVEEVKMKKLE